jgi:hypothetical protein
MPALNNSTKSLISYGVKLTTPIIASKAVSFVANYYSGSRDFSKIFSEYKEHAVDSFKINWVQPYLGKGSAVYKIADTLINYTSNYLEEKASEKVQEFIITDSEIPKDFPSLVSYGAIKLLQFGIEYYSQSKSSGQKALENSSPQLLLEDGEVKPVNGETNLAHTESLANSYVGYEDSHHHLDQSAEDDIGVFGDCVDTALDSN